MRVSDNIRPILENSTEWSFFTNRSYPAEIQLADPQQIYNVPGQPGVVYNILEDAYEKVGSTGYVVTGIAGEMWPIAPGAVVKYNIDPAKIGAKPLPVQTVELDTVYAAIVIPADTAFTLEVNYGERAVLKGNRTGIAHGSGDRILVYTKCDDGIRQPDFSDSGRIVNGAIFDKLYKPFTG
ncbi:MAG: hypothetical protein MJ065_04825 [Oscillospiraceae bacterium]|nr:hypothetical protein [Oscillospiraceae bacterium]